MKEVPLTQGYVAVVDDEDFERVNAIKWQLRRSGPRLYAQTTQIIGGKKVAIKLHRFVMGFPQNRDVDHWDGDGLNNRRSNLRVATRAENLRNQRRSRGGSSRFKGVSWEKKDQKWYAYISVSGRRKFLGYHPSEEAAALAYNGAALHHFGEFAALNVVQEQLVA